MFFFERDVGGRLIMAARKELPDATGIPSLVDCLNQSQLKLRNTVLAMVRRGDFECAVRKLTNLLQQVCAEHKFEFKKELDEGKPLGVDSLLVIFEALLAAFNQQMIEMRLLNDNSIDTLHSCFRPMCSIYLWSEIQSMPPLDNWVAHDLLELAIRIMPAQKEGCIHSDFLSEDLEAQLMDVCLSMLQRIYMSNPRLILDAASKALAEWDYPARIDLMVLSPLYDDTLESSLKLARSYLPRVNNNDQLKLMWHVQVGLMRGVISRPDCSWSLGAGCYSAIQSLISAVEKSRSFRALRAFRTHEALLLTMLDLIKIGRNAYHDIPKGPGLENVAVKSSTRPVRSIASSQNQHHQHHQHSPQHQHHHQHPAQHEHSHSQHYHHNHSTEEYNNIPKEPLSVAHLKPFERAVALLKRENPADKRVASRHAAIDYLISIGFLGFAASERPLGKPYIGLAQDVKPYLPLIIEEYDVLSSEYKIKLFCCCMCIAPTEYERLRKGMDPTFCLQILRVILTTANVPRFIAVFESHESLFREYVDSALKRHDFEKLYTALTLLFCVPYGAVPRRILRDLLVRLTLYLSTHPDISDTNRQILEAYIARYVFEAGLDYCVDTLKPLIPTANPENFLRDPQLLRAPYYLLKLLAHDRRIVPVEYLEGAGLLAGKLKHLRTALLLCLCLDSNTYIELVLKCLDLLQSDPTQSPAERDLVSELLDSMDQALPSISLMQKRMLASLASESDPCFQPLSDSVRKALSSSHDKPYPHAILGNLLRMRTATLFLEPPAVRASFYSELVNIDGSLLRIMSDSLPLGSRLASEIFMSITKINSSLALKGPINGSQLTGTCQLHVWLLHCLETDHPFPAPELRLGEICTRAVSSLTPSSAPRHESAVLKLVEAAAKYASADQVPLAISILFEKVAIMILERNWDSSNLKSLVSVLATLFQHYKQPESEKLERLICQILQLHPVEAQISVLTPLLNENLEFLMYFYDKKCVLSDVYRASVYEALTRRSQSKKLKSAQHWDSGDFVTFLLDNRPIIKALSDVCSVNEDDGVFAALLKLFRSHSKAAERRLIEIAVEHEVKNAQVPADLLRSNSIAMKVLLEWLGSVSGNYLTSVLGPALGSLRSASIRDDADMETLFTDATKRFKSRVLPIHVHWLLHIVTKEVTPKFGADVARQSLSVLLVLRFVCPAVIAPHQFGIARRPPARQFALLLRKFAVFLQRRREALLADMEYIDHLKAISNNDGVTPPSLSFDEQMDYLLNDKEANQITAKVEFDDEYISATRQVFHFLRRHSVEVRVVLLSNGYSDIVAKMFQYFRIGRTQESVNLASLENAEPTAMPALHELKGERVVSVLARSICSDEAAPKKVLQTLITYNEPTVIDFTDFSGLFDRWAELMLYLAFNAPERVLKRWKLRLLNCPRRTTAVINRLGELISLNVETSYFTSVDFTDISEVPANLPEFQSAVIDLQDAVKFDAKVRSGPAIAFYTAELYVGAKYLQIISEGACDVIPYVPLAKECALTFRIARGDLHITGLGIDLTVLKPNFSFLRVLELSLIAADAIEHGATIDLKKATGLTSSPDGNETNLLADHRAKHTDSLKPMVGALSHDIAHDFPEQAAEKISIMDAICPGRLLFSALYDALHDDADVRRRAVEAYTILPDVIGLKLSILSPQQCATSNQICLLSESAAKSHPELASCVVTAFAMLGTEITERAAQIASPWVQFLEANSAKSSNLLRERILRPLLQAVSDSPDNVGPILLEYFWPQLRDIPVLSVDILMEMAITASGKSLESLRQIVANGISLNRPHESREFAEALLASLHSRLRAKNSSATHWSQHPEWHEINVSLILFGSVVVDGKTAEVLFPEVSFLLLIFAGVGNGQLRSAMNLLLINYLNAFLQSPSTSQGQRQRLHLVRAELMGPRGAALFGVHNDPESGIPEWECDNYTEYSPESTEHLGRLLSDIMAAVFSTRLSGYQETRVAISSRVMEFIDVDWPPLQRRCILALIGAVRILMPDKVASDLIVHLGRILEDQDESALPTRGVLTASYLRMFSEVIDCIPDTGSFHQYLFWLSVISLATGCSVIKESALRLLTESIKIAHFRGVFRDKTMSEFYLETAPQWVGNTGESGSLWPLDTPSTETNFHISLAQLLILPLQEPETQALALNCCEVLSTACPNEFVYASFLYLCGEEGIIASRAPTGAFLDTDDAILQWLASRIHMSSPSSVIALALCAEISGFSRSVNISQKGPRLLDLVQKIDDRRVINIISPLLRATFLRLLELDDRNITIGLKGWTSKIFSRSTAERASISKDESVLMNMVLSMQLRPWFNNAYKIHPLFYEEEFSETTRSALSNSNWIQNNQVLLKGPETTEPASNQPFENELLL